MEIRRIISRFLPIAFVLFGILVIILAFISLHQQNSFTAATGVITNIEEFTDGVAETTYEVTVDYKIDGKSYTSVMGDYSPDYEVGKEINILYDPDDPSKIVSKGKSHVIYMICVGVVLIIAGAITFLRGLAR